MAKALIGFVGGPTADQAREAALLRRRIRDLEVVVLRLKSENDALSQALSSRVQEMNTADLLAPLAH